MSLYEKMLESAAGGKDSGVRSLFLGWKGSAIILEDGRWGVGAVPPSERDSHSPREPHTRLLLSATAREIALLAVSPYPQEFAAASAALSALLPPTEGGCPLEALLSLPGEDRVSFLRTRGFRISSGTGTGISPSSTTGGEALPFSPNGQAPSTWHRARGYGSPPKPSAPGRS
ncbi:hypothetical protein MASR1M66_15050 [Aminivibrio sp.]